MTNAEKIKTKISMEKAKNLMKMFDYSFADYEKLNMVPYDKVVAPGSYGFDGRNAKMFKLCDSKNFGEMINEIQGNPDCSYITYANSVIKEGIVPEKLSVMDKTSDKVSVINESIAAKVLNYFGVPTSYYLLANNKSQNHSVSVDFIGGNEEFIELYTMLPKVDDVYIIEQTYRMVNIVEHYLKNLFKGDEPENFKQNFEKFKKDLIISFFVRQFVLGDTDCGMSNVGLLINTETWDFRLINFDLEWTMTKWLGAENFNFEYAMRECPKEVKEIYNKCAELLKAMDEVYPSLADMPINLLPIRNNIVNLLFTIKKYEAEKVSG